jgi:hypothetical protein
MYAYRDLSLCTDMAVFWNSLAIFMNQSDKSHDFWYVMPCRLVNVCQFVTNQHNPNSYKNRFVTNTAVVTTKPSKCYGFGVLRFEEEFNT